MRIINPGPDYSLPWSYQTSCGRCHTVVELELSDARRGDEGGFNEMPQHCIYWQCPFCGNQPNFPREMWKVLEFHRPELRPYEG